MISIPPKTCLYSLLNIVLTGLRIPIDSFIPSLIDQFVSIIIENDATLHDIITSRVEIHPAAFGHKYLIVENTGI